MKNTAHIRRLSVWSLLMFAGVLALTAFGVACGDDEPTPTRVTVANTPLPPTAMPTSEPAELESVTIELDWFPNSNHVGIFVAQDRGFFEEEGLDVEAITPADPAAVARLVGAGRRDFGIYYQTDTLLARDEEIPVVAVRSIVQRPLNCVMALQSSGITRPADLKGKKVGYPGIEWNIKMLETMLAADGLSIDDVEVVDVGWSLWETLAAGTVDALIGAYWSHESIVLEDKGYPMQIIYADDYNVPAYYEMMLVTSEDMVSENPDTVRRFARAFVRGYEWARENPDAALDILFRLNPDQKETENVERVAIHLLTDAWVAERGEVGTLTETRWNEVGDFMKQKGMISDDLDVDEAWASALIE